MSVRSELLLLAAGSALLFSSWLGARDLWNPNEPVYGQAVSEMVQRDAWLVPTVNGRVFDEKPILYFWAAAAASRLLGGPHESVLRLPSAASGVASVLLTYWLVLPYAGRRRARLSAWILATTFIVFWSARSIQMDLMLAACTLGTIVPVAGLLDHGRPARRGWTIAGAAAGLGFLAKGPVGLICPGLPLVLYAASTGRLRALLGRPVLAGLAAFLAVATPWPLLLWLRGHGDFLVEMVYRQNFVRFVDPWDHQGPWWYFLKYFWIDMAPWSLFLPLACGLRPVDGPERKLHRLAWIWIAATVVFFSLSASKRSPYILPVAPAMALLVAAWVDRWSAGAAGSLRLRLGTAVWAVWGAVMLAAAAGVWREAGGAEIQPALAIAGQRTALALAAAGLVTVGVLWPVRRRPVAPAFAVAGLVTVYLVASATVLPAADAVKSHRSLCESIASHVPAGEPLYGYRLWEWRSSYSYYAKRTVRNLESLEQLRELWESPGPVYVIVERGRIDEARAVLGESRPLVERGVGNNYAYLFATVRQAR